MNIHFHTFSFTSTIRQLFDYFDPIFQPTIVAWHQAELSWVPKRLKSIDYSRRFSPIMRFWKRARLRESNFMTIFSRLTAFLVHWKNDPYFRKIFQKFLWGIPKGVPKQFFKNSNLENNSHSDKLFDDIYIKRFINILSIKIEKKMNWEICSKVTFLLLSLY